MIGKLVIVFNLVTFFGIALLLVYSYWSLDWSKSSRTKLKSSNRYISRQRGISQVGKLQEFINADQQEMTNPELGKHDPVISRLDHVAEGSAMIYVDLEKLKTQLRKSYKECHDVDNPFTLWKSQHSDVTNHTADLDFERITKASMCGGLLQPEFLATPPREDMYPFEVAYLSVPPVWQESEVSSHLHSTIRLVGSKSNFTVGDTVDFVINIADKEGRPKVKGGDRIKVWVKDVKYQHSISAKIVDLDNGTYLATTVLPWEGTVRVMAVLRNPREYMRALIYTHRVMKSTLTFAGAYKNSKASEAVPCSSFPIVPGFHKSELCNLTLVNGHSPWFCGRPSKSELNCSDFRHIRYVKQSVVAPTTPAEASLLRQTANQLNYLKGQILLSVKPGKLGATRLKDPDVACNKVPAISTWQQGTPPGYFYNSTWKSFLCHIPETINSSCLENVQMVFYGDSNSREFYDSVRKRTKCLEVFTLTAPKSLWHPRKICENKASNFTVQFSPHSSPYHAQQFQFTDFALLQHPSKLLDLIPATGRYIISLSHYLHYTSHHISAFEHAMVALRETLIKLLDRNPDVLVILRAPHVAELAPQIFVKGDNLAEHFITIQREIFESLQNKVIYFPTWDITVASEDYRAHPKCNDHIAHVMLQFLCGREN